MQVVTQAAVPPTPPVAANKATNIFKLWLNIAVRLTHEGVPLRAIVRALMLPYETVHAALVDARERGLIISLPRDDWPPGLPRDEHKPGPSFSLSRRGQTFEDETLILGVMSALTFTSSEASMLVALLRRRYATKVALHDATTRLADNPDEQSGIKIVDVFICKMRAKLKKISPDITIETIWGKGYALSKGSRAALLLLLGLDAGFNPAGAEAGEPQA